jgi:hypothetical protein
VACREAERGSVPAVHTASMAVPRRWSARRDAGSVARPGSRQSWSRHSPTCISFQSLPRPAEPAARSTAGGARHRPGSAPDRFMVGLAVLSLLSTPAEERPLICLVDDAQWLDRPSAQTLEFVARRLASQAVAMLFAVGGSNGEPIPGRSPSSSTPRKAAGTHPCSHFSYTPPCGAARRWPAASARDTGAHRRASSDHRGGLRDSRPLLDRDHRRRLRTRRSRRLARSRCHPRFRPRQGRGPNGGQMVVKRLPEAVRGRSGFLRNGPLSCGFPLSG